jgi:hypothetical protein
MLYSHKMCIDSPFHCVSHPSPTCCTQANPLTSPYPSGKQGVGRSGSWVVIYSSICCCPGATLKHPRILGMWLLLNTEPPPGHTIKACTRFCTLLQGHCAGQAGPEQPAGAGHGKGRQEAAKATGRQAQQLYSACCLVVILRLVPVACAR